MSYEDEEFTSPADETLSLSDKITVSIPAQTLRQIADAVAVQAQRVIDARIKKTIDSVIVGMVEEKLREAIGSRVEALVQDHLTKPRQKTNTWGEPIGGQATSFADLLPDMVKNYLDEKVNSEGRPDRSYGKTSRIDYIIGTVVRAPLDVEVKAAASRVTEQAKKVVADSVGRYVAEQLAPSIDAKKISQEF